LYPEGCEEGVTPAATPHEVKPETADEGDKGDATDDATDYLADGDFSSWTRTLECCRLGG
jgi:hypothetical protein